MPIYTSAIPGRLLNFERFASEQPGTLGQELGATASEAFSDSPINSLNRIFELRNAEQSGTTLSKADADQRIEAAGVKGLLTVPDAGITDQALDVLIQRKRAEVKRQDAIASGPQGFLPGVAKFATSFAASALDPINDVAAFVPVVGEARYMSMLARAGGAFGRAGVRAAVGAAEGAAGMALIEPVTYVAKSQEQADYGMSDALLNVAFGGAFGGGLHVLGGAAKDIFSAASAAHTAANSPLSVREPVLRTAVGQLQNGEAVNIEPIIEAWHGSPHKFETFDTGRIGTGEGSDAYGAGLYFGEARAVGEHYRDNLSPDRGYAQQRIAELQKGIAEAETRIADVERIHGKEAMAQVAAQERVSIKEMQAEIVRRTDSLGHLYEVNIKAPPETLLDLDKPLSEQAPQVRAALESSDKATVDPKANGHKFYAQLLTAFGGDKQAVSEHLKSLGIRGLKYLDEQSRTPIAHKPLSPARRAQIETRLTELQRNAIPSAKNGEALAALHDEHTALSTELARGNARPPTHNYVIFDARDAVALRRNGEDLPSAARRQGSPENSLTAEPQSADAAGEQLKTAVEPDEEGNALRAQVDADVARLQEAAQANGVDVSSHLKELDQFGTEADTYAKAAKAAVLCGVNH